MILPDISRRKDMAVRRSVSITAICTICISCRAGTMEKLFIISTEADTLAHSERQTSIPQCVFPNYMMMRT